MTKKSNVFLLLNSKNANLQVSALTSKNSCTKSHPPSSIFLHDFVFSDVVGKVSTQEHMVGDQSMGWYLPSTASNRGCECSKGKGSLLPWDSHQPGGAEALPESFTTCSSVVCT